MTATREGATARPSPAVAGCFVDTMRPVTPAKTAAWRFYLGLHRDHWRAARMTFRRVCSGEAPELAVIAFVGESGISEPEAVSEMERVIEALAQEVRR